MQSRKVFNLTCSVLACLPLHKCITLFVLRAVPQDKRASAAALFTKRTLASSTGSEHYLGKQPRSKERALCRTRPDKSTL
jgi:hypothetical protein